MKLEDYFPDLPTPPASGYMFMIQEKKGEIGEQLKAHPDYAEYTAWLETLDDDKRELYEANEMRLAKKSDPNNKSQIMIETGTESLDYLDIQPKTPAVPHYSDSDEDD